LQLGAWRLALGACNFFPVTTGLGPCFMDVVPGWNGWPEKILMRVFWGFSVSGM
jgi:hypothetical protein